MVYQMNTSKVMMRALQKAKIKSTKILWVFLFAFGILFATATNKTFSSRSSSGFVSQVELEKERECLLQTLYHEARSEPEEGIRAVLTVIKNRKNSKAYPNTFCGVIYQPNQFSFRNHLKPGEKMPTRPTKALDKEKHRVIVQIVDEVLTGRFKPVLDSDVLHYAHVKVKNRWTRKYKVVMIAGQHKFYKES